MVFASTKEKTAEKSPPEKSDEELAKERYNDPNKTDEQRMQERRKGQNLPEPETPEQKATRLAAEKMIPRDRRETEEQKTLREGKEEAAMREKADTMIREIIDLPPDSLGVPFVSIREMKEPTGRGDQQAAVKEKSESEPHKVKK